MRLTNKVLNDTILEVIGEHAIPIVEFLRGKEKVSEFIIGEELGLDIHVVRQILYKLHDNNLVTYIRKKDRQKGWYISYWTFDAKRVKELIIRIKTQKLDMLRERLQKESDNRNCFFMCPNTCVRLDFDGATNFDYKCPECGSILNQQNNHKTIENIKERIKAFEEELETA